MKMATKKRVDAKRGAVNKPKPELRRASARDPHTIASWIAYTLSSNNLSEPDGFAVVRSVVPGGLPNATDADLVRAGRVLGAIEEAFMFDSPEAWQRITEAFEAVEGMKPRAAKAERVRQCVAGFARHRDKYGGFPWFNHDFVRGLAYIEPRFELLDVAFARRVLNAVKLGKNPTKGGAGNLQPARAAARLAVKCGAFGLQSESVAYKFFVPSRAPQRS